MDRPMNEPAGAVGSVAQKLRPNGATEPRLAQPGLPFNLASSCCCRCLIVDGLPLPWRSMRWQRALP